MRGEGGMSHLGSAIGMIDNMFKMIFSQISTGFKLAGLLANRLQLNVSKSACNNADESWQKL